MGTNAGRNCNTDSISSVEGPAKIWLEITTLSQFYDYIGNGSLQYITWVTAFLVGYIDYAEIYILSILIPTLRCDWNLSEKMETALGFSVYGAYAASCLIVPSFSDRLGRKRAFTCAAFGLVIASLSASILSNQWAFLLSRLVIGGCAGTSYVTFVSYSVEIAPEKYRTVGNLLGGVGCFTSYLLLNVQGLFFLQRLGWRLFLVILTAPGIIVAGIMLYLPESPRYLLVSAKTDRLNQMLKYMAMNRGKSLEGVSLQINVEADVKDKLGSLWEIFGTSYCKDLGLMSLFFFCNMYLDSALLAYVPLILTTTTCFPNKAPLRTCQILQTNDFYFILAVALAGILGVVMVAVWVQRRTRLPILRWTIGGAMVPTGLLYFCVNKYFTVSQLMVLKFLIVSANVVFWVYMAEYLPTYIRSTGMGLINCLGKVGGSFGGAGVYLFLYKSHNVVLILMLVAGLLGFIASLFLKCETMDRPLYDDNSKRGEQT